MAKLDVYLKDELVGVLEESAAALSFTYDEKYLAANHPEALSFSLPLRVEAYVGEVVENFFSNLLPDDYVRTRLGEILQIPRENTFALLEAIGGDCAGAIALYSEGMNPQSAAMPSFRKLSDDEAVQILADLEKRPLNIGEEGFRISGAGAQDKLVACVEQGKILLPLNGTPSTHIIKPAIRNYPGSVENEWFSMQLARACGLNVADCNILTINGNRYYVTARFDREVKDGLCCRLHQEDICQLLNIDPKRKYEKNGGPGIAQIFALLRTLELSAAETLEFLNRIIFNFLLGNGDAHGKNFSVLYRGGKCILAPMYDIMNTTIYPELAKTMAMKVDGEYAFKWITRGKFVRMGEKLGLGAKLVEKSLDRMIDKITKMAPRLVAKCNRAFPSPIYEEISNNILARITHNE